MIDLINMVKARAVSLTAGMQLDNPVDAPAGKRNIAFYSHGVPPKKDPKSDQEDFPFVAVRLLAGSEETRAGLITVRLIGGIFTWGDFEAGGADIISLQDILLKLQQQKAFSPYTLKQPLKWWLGDKAGMQPHPYYYLTIDCQFSRQPLARNGL